jgi:hypothetical protein
MRSSDCSISVPDGSFHIEKVAGGVELAQVDGDLFETQALRWRRTAIGGGEAASMVLRRERLTFSSKRYSGERV